MLIANERVHAIQHFAREADKRWCHMEWRPTHSVSNKRYRLSRQRVRLNDIVIDEINDIVYDWSIVTINEGLAMTISINQADELLILLGNLLQQAALASQAVIDAIPADASIDEEASVIEVAIAPVDGLARLILRSPHKRRESKAVIARARAWMEGNYWATFREAA